VLQRYIKIYHFSLNSLLSLPLSGKVEFEGRDLARGNGVTGLSGAFSAGKVSHVKIDLAR
jgi:hypothetical protein